MFAFDAKLLSSMLNFAAYNFLIATSYDFKESSQTVRFAPRETTKIVYIKIEDDDRVENTEAFVVEILIPTTLYSQSVRYGNPHRVKVYIKDGEQQCKYLYVSLLHAHASFR